MVGAILHADAIVSCQLGEFLTATEARDAQSPGRVPGRRHGGAAAGVASSGSEATRQQNT